MQGKRAFRETQKKIRGRDGGYGETGKKMPREGKFRGKKESLKINGGGEKLHYQRENNFYYFKEKGGEG